MTFAQMNESSKVDSDGALKRAGGLSCVVWEGDGKNVFFFGTLSAINGQWGFKSPKLFSENTHSGVCTVNIQKCPEAYNT